MQRIQGQVISGLAFWIRSPDEQPEKRGPNVDVVNLARVGPPFSDDRFLVGSLDDVPALTAQAQRRQSMLGHDADGIHAPQAKRTRNAGGRFPWNRPGMGSWSVTTGRRTASSP